MMNITQSFAIFASNTQKAKLMKSLLEQTLSPIVSKEQADIWIVLGGDGMLLNVFQELVKQKKERKILPALYGINCGSVGFLMNAFDSKDKESLYDQILNAEKVKVYPLFAEVTTLDGQNHKYYALNEFALMRKTHYASHLQIELGVQPNLKPKGVDPLQSFKVIGDGLLLAGPVGSCAYNYSAGGAILPLNANVLSLTALNAYQPGCLKTILVDQKTVVHIQTLQGQKRPVTLTADQMTVSDIDHVTIFQDFDFEVTLMYRRDFPLSQKILKKQFQQDLPR